MRRLLLLTWILILPTALFGQNYPTSVSIYVNDFAEIVDDETEARITEVLKGARENRDAEITVVTINQIADYGATGSVPNFATGLFNSWGVGVI